MAKDSLVFLLHAMIMTSSKTCGHPEMYFLSAFKIPCILRYISNYISNKNQMFQTLYFEISWLTPRILFLYISQRSNILKDFFPLGIYKFASNRKLFTSMNGPFTKLHCED